MTMGRLGLALCVLLVLAAAEAGRKKSHRHRKYSRFNALPSILTKIMSGWLNSVAKFD